MSALAPSAAAFPFAASAPTFRNWRPRAHHEALFHAAGVPAGLIHLRHPRRAAVRDELAERRLERAIGMVYRPDTELQSHYFQAVLPRQFDEYIWFDRSSAVTPLPSELPTGVPDTYPFGL